MRNASPSSQTFEFVSLRFVFSALDEFVFPAFLSANIFRGAFGLVLRANSPAVYAEFFSPPRLTSGPSGLADRPRPFVFRTRHLDGTTIRPMEAFAISLNLFCGDAHLAQLTQAFEQMCERGFGPQRSRAQLIKSDCTPHQCSLAAAQYQDAQRIRVDFLTPTELKSSSVVFPTPEFGILIRRARDRISTLRALYGPGPLEIDFESFTERAAAVQLTRDETHHVSISRRSSRTKQVHPLGGFAGFAEYTGAVSEFLPFLQAAAYTGVGRQTVWGKGEIATRIVD